MSLLSDVKALFINGVQVLVKQGTFNANFGGFTHSPVLANLGVAGASRQVVEATCDFTVALPAGTDVDAVFAIRDGQIRVVYDNGAEWLLKKATLRDPISISGGSGDAAVTYFGTKWKQTKLGS
jgi:hypothetical protein